MGSRPPIEFEFEMGATNVHVTSIIVEWGGMAAKRTEFCN